MRGTRALLPGCLLILFAALALERAAAQPLTRRYVGELGDHQSIEMALTVEGDTVTGYCSPLGQADRLQLEGTLDREAMRLRGYGAGRRFVANLRLTVDRDGLVGGTWSVRSNDSQSEGSLLPVALEQIGNDLPQGAAINGHYAGERGEAYASLDLLVLEPGRIKVQGLAAEGGGARPRVKEIAGFGTLDGEVVIFADRAGCRLKIRPSADGLEVEGGGACAGTTGFAGRYRRTSATIGAWDTFRWAAP